MWNAMGDRRGVHKVVMGKPDRQRERERERESPLGRPRRRWVHNIKTDLQEIGFGVCSGMVQVYIVKTI
jgi:hypothetical protein